jgi:hypothetical protein
VSASDELSYFTNQGKLADKFNDRTCIDEYAYRLRLVDQVLFKQTTCFEIQLQYAPNPPYVACHCIYTTMEILITWSNSDDQASKHVETTLHLQMNIQLHAINF